jgi:hypothetical protein
LHNKQRVDRHFVSLALTGMARKRNDNYSDQHNNHSSAASPLFYSFRRVRLTAIPVFPSAAPYILNMIYAAIFTMFAVGECDGKHH